MKPAKILLTLGAAFLATVSAQAVPWVSRHNMTAKDYQTEFNKWTQSPYHYRLISVAGYEKSGEARYAAIWEERPGSGWLTYAGMTQAQYDSTNASHVLQDFHPVFISALGVGNQALYNAIWEYSPRADVVSEVGLSYAAYVSANSTRISQGYKLVHLWTCNAGATELFAAIWRKGDPAGYQVRVRRTSAEYQQEFDQLGGQGYQLIMVSAAVVNGQSLFTGVWKQPSDTDAWASHHDLSELNYQAQTWNWEYQGYRPVFASAFNPAGGERFNVIFHRNGGMTPANLAVLDEAMTGYMQSADVPGLSLAISRNGQLVYAKGWGQADQGANEWVHPFHRFRVASISKPITAVAVLKLRDCCGLDLDQTVFGAGSILGNSFGTPGDREEDIHVRHLLEHTTGWDGETDGVWNVGGSDPGPAIAWQINNTDPVDDPGNIYDYMNTDYATLGRVIERISGRPYEQFVQEEILAPSCIAEMEIGGESLAERKPYEVVYYPNQNNDQPYALSPPRMDAHGGWIAKPMDLLLLLRRFDGDPAHAEILSADSLTEMRTGSAASGSGYGLGLLLGTDGWGHNGSMAGTIGFLEYRTDGLAFAVTCNVRTTNDLYAFILKGLINDVIDTLNATNAWPNIDLFPCNIPPGDPPQTMEVPKDIYVDGSCNSLLPNGQKNCSLLGGPFPTVNQGVSAICAGDRLFIRAGSYNEAVLFNRYTTVRSYDGTVVIGQ